MANIKGMFLTIGFSLIGIIMLTLAVFLANDVTKADERLSELGKLERVKELGFSIENTILEIFKQHSNINLNLGTTTFTIQETLPNSRSTLSTKLNDLETYIETNFQSSPNITINDQTKQLVEDELPIHIKPFNIIYKHNSDSEIEIRPEKKETSYDIISYNIDLIFSGSATLQWIELNEGTDLNTRISNGGSLLEAKNLDSTKTSRATVTSGATTVTITFSDPAKLVLSSSGSLPITVIVGTNSANYPNEHLSAYLPNELIKIDLTELNTIKRGTVKIS